MDKILHELIIVISNKGYTDVIMDTAKLRGARGGTIVHGKGTANEETRHFFGLKIQAEKELLLIVVPKEKTTEIMQAISDNHGVNSEARSLCFSLPITRVLGFTF